MIDATIGLRSGFWSWLHPVDLHASEQMTGNKKNLGKTVASAFFFRIFKN
jgi:hypothetical protein